MLPKLLSDPFSVVLGLSNATSDKVPQRIGYALRFVNHSFCYIVSFSGRIASVVVELSR
jgi:hypothetical protein